MTVVTNTCAAFFDCFRFEAFCQKSKCTVSIIQTVEHVALLLISVST